MAPRPHQTGSSEEFLLEPAGGYDVYDATFRYLFNSYYEAVGPRHPRPHRGLVTRPSAAEVGRYRAHVDGAVERLLQAGRADEDVLVLGLNYEQQHQELLVMDAKHLLSCHPFGPALVDRPAEDDPVPGFAQLARRAGRSRRGRARRRRSRLRLRQRGAAAPGVAGAVRDRRARRQQRGLARLHGRRRVRKA